MKSTLLHDLDEYLHAELRTHRVPGASLAVLRDDQVYFSVAGLANVETDEHVSKRTPFYIGSTTKSMTATLVMQLVEEGKIALDSPVQRYLPKFQLAGPSDRITVRHLLAHTSGIKGDFFIDVGDGDDAISRYVDALRVVPVLYEPGRLYSYCNAGYPILGRICEVVEQATWDELISRRLFVQAAMTRAASRTADKAAMGVAVGYERDRSGALHAVARGSRSGGPSGSTVVCTAEDLITFARVHLDCGATSGGSRILSAGSVITMQTPQVAVPGGLLADHWGLGWMLMRWNDVAQYGHDGATAGTLSLLRILPERRTAIALLCNGGDRGDFMRSVAGGLFRKLAGVDFPQPPVPCKERFDLQSYAGRFERYFARIDVEPDGDELVCRGYGLDPTSGELVTPDPVQIIRLKPSSREVFVETTTGRLPQSIGFLEFDATGTPQYLFHGARALKRVGQ